MFNRFVPREVQAACGLLYGLKRPDGSLNVLGVTAVVAVENEDLRESPSSTYQPLAANDG